MSEEIVRCKERVWPPPGWHSYQCTRKVWKDGYCKQHHPDSVKKRREETENRRHEQFENSPYCIIQRLTEENKKLKEENVKLKEDNEKLKLNKSDI